MDIGSLIVITIALAAGAVCKGATGMGLPLIAIPVIASFLGLQQAIGVLVVPILISNFWQVWQFRAARSDPKLRFLAPMLAGCAVGVVLGTWLLVATPERGLTLALGLLLIGYLALRLVRPTMVLSSERAEKTAVPVGVGTGILHGATGISAPIGVTFIHSMAMAKPSYILAVSAMFIILGLVQLPALWIAGILEPVWLLQGVYSLAPIVFFMPVGHWMASKLSPKAFDRMVLFFLGAMGLKLTLGI